MWVFADPEDERRILRAHYEYARALDERDWSALAHIFDGDSCARYGDGPSLHGLEAITASIRGFLEDSGPTQHLISNVVVTDEQGQLESRAVVRAIHRSKADAGTFASFATYLARWAPTARGLRAREWRMDVQFNEGNPSIIGI